MMFTTVWAIYRLPEKYVSFVLEYGMYYDSIMALVLAYKGYISKNLHHIFVDSILLVAAISAFF